MGGDGASLPPLPHRERASSISTRVRVHATGRSNRHAPAVATTMVDAKHRQPGQPRAPPPDAVGEAAPRSPGRASAHGAHRGGAQEPHGGASAEGSRAAGGGAPGSAGPAARAGSGSLSRGPVRSGGSSRAETPRSADGSARGQGQDYDTDPLGVGMHDDEYGVERTGLHGNSAELTQLTCKAKRDAYLIKRIGDKFYNYGSKQGKLRQTFRKMDQDKNGTVSREELRAGLAQFNFGLSELDFQRLVSTVDKDNSDSIDYEEFMRFFEAFEPLVPSDGPRPKHMLLSAPWEQGQRLKGDYLAFKQLADIERRRAELLFPDHPPGSYEEQEQDSRILDIISNKFQQHESQLRVIFRRFDVDRNGSISADEFVKGVRKLNLGLGDKHVRRFMEMIDKDGSGSLDYEEFLNRFDSVDRVKAATKVPPAEPEPPAPDAPEVRAMADRINELPIIDVLRTKLYQSKSRILRLFKQFDVNGDGQVSHAELKAGLSTLLPHAAEKEIRALVVAADASGDGYLNYREFMHFLEGSIEDGDANRHQSFHHGNHRVESEKTARDIAAHQDATAPGAPRGLAGGAADGWPVSPSAASSRDFADGGSEMGFTTAEPSPGAASRTFGRHHSPTTAGHRNPFGERGPAARTGRFTATPAHQNTFVLTQAPAGTAAHAAPVQQYRTSVDRNGAIASMQAEDRAKKAARLQANIQKREAMTAFEQQRKAGDETRLATRDAANLKSIALHNTAYLERMRLYEGAGTHMQRNWANTYTGSESYANFFDVRV